MIPPLVPIAEYEVGKVNLVLIAEILINIHLIYSVFYEHLLLPIIATESKKRVMGRGGL